mmetsp:Transcript_14156/g.40488  ORF Transcript_14156/g.40488 Transcript_14156/m.40488 type:complete len:226 (-) Transcript_14156:235-912(-)
MLHTRLLQGLAAPAILTEFCFRGGLLAAYGAHALHGAQLQAVAARGQAALHARGAGGRAQAGLRGARRQRLRASHGGRRLPGGGGGSCNRFLSFCPEGQREQLREVTGRAPKPSFQPSRADSDYGGHWRLLLLCARRRRCRGHTALQVNASGGGAGEERDPRVRTSEGPSDPRAPELHQWLRTAKVQRGRGRRRGAEAPEAGAPILKEDGAAVRVSPGRPSELPH